jgi:hypothetical protein
VQGDLLWQFQIGLYYTLVRSPFIISPPQPLWAPLKAIARGFFVLFHTSVWCPSTIHPHLNLPTTSNPLHTHTVPICPVFGYYYLSWCSKGFLYVCLLWVYFTLVPSIALPYPFTSHPLFFNTYISIHNLLSSSTLTDVVFYNIINALSFSFPFPLSPSSIE